MIPHANAATVEPISRAELAKMRKARGLPKYAKPQRLYRTPNAAPQWKPKQKGRHRRCAECGGVVHTTKDQGAVCRTCDPQAREGLPLCVWCGEPIEGKKANAKYHDPCLADKERERHAAKQRRKAGRG